MADTLCKHGSASCGWCHDKSGALFHEAAQTTMADTSELLTFCDEAEEKCRVGRQDGHWPEIAPHKIEAIVRYAKSRLQAEAPLDTKVAGSWCKKCGHYFPDPSHEAGCQSRTSQAEAQAPARPDATEINGHAVIETLALAYTWISGGFPAQAQDVLRNALLAAKWKINPKFAWGYQEHKPTTTAPAPVDARLMEDEQDAYDLAARYASKNSDFPAELFARLVCVIDRLLSSPKAVAPSTTKEGRG